MVNILTNCVNVLGTDLYDLIQEVFKIIKICVPILVVVLISIDMLSCVTAGDEEKMKAAQNRSVKRLIIGVVIFFIPTFVNLIIKYSNSNIQVCWGEEYDQISENLKVQKSECEALNNSSTVISYEWNSMDETCDKINVKKGASSLTYFNQRNYSNVDFCNSSHHLSGSGCGAVSLSMIAYSYSDTKYTPPVVASILCKNTKYGISGGVYEQDLKELAYLFNLNSEYLFFDKTYYKTSGCPSYPTERANKIVNAILNDGKSIILGVPGHYVTLGPNEKCTSNQIYLYDPWTTKMNGCYSIKEIWEKTKKPYYVSSSYCGWNSAIAYSSL